MTTTIVEIIAQLEKHGFANAPDDKDSREAYVQILRAQGFKVHSRKDKFYGKWLIIKHRAPDEPHRKICW